MRVHYIVLGSISEGVLFKLQEKIKAFQNEVGFAQLILISEISKNHTQISDKVLRIRYQIPTIFERIPYFWRLTVLLYRLIGAYHFYKVVAKIDRSDTILVRYPIADYFLYRAFQLLGKRKFIFEHNTKELNELKLRSINSYWFNYLYNSEKKYGKLLRDKASYLVAVSQDFLSYQINEYRSMTKGKVISNGYSVEKHERRILKKSNELRFLMLIGSYAEWHGLDIMINALKSLNDNINNFYLHVVGKVPEGVQSFAENELKENVVFHGQLSFNERLSVAQKCHIGIGALGLKRLGISIGSSLKVREYLANGMPVIISVDDEDVDQAAISQKLCLKVEIENDSFDLLSAVNSIGDLVYRQDHNDSIRQYALDHIDYKIKTRQYVEIFNELELAR